MKKILTFLLSLVILFGYHPLFAQPDKPPYVSAVPKFTFGKTLKEQEAQLKTNPLMLRLEESRKKLAGDQFRPIYHYVNPEGKLNDPNGLCFWQGNWHLFYQGYPPEDPRQHWGHAISKDLVHWRDLPYAIYPSPERAVFSGSTLVEDNRVIAMYHGTAVGNMVAVSSDPLLLNWEKVTGNAVIPAKSTTGSSLPYSVFDPSIWKKGNMYYALSAGRTPTGPGGRPVRADYLFRSKDLKKWEYMHEFVQDDRFTLIGDDGACPYFWPIGDRYIMNFFSHMSGGQYLLGDYDKKNDKFIATSGGKYNHGAVGPSGVHAPSAAPDGKGGVVVIFNMNPGKPSESWNQIMSLPRRLTLLSKDELGQEPAADLGSLRYGAKHIEKMKLPANQEIVLNDVKGNAMEISAEIDPQKAQFIELNLLRSPNKEEYTRIVFFREKGFGKGLEYRSGPQTASMPADLVNLFTGEKPAPRTPNVPASLISIESSYSSTLPDVGIRAPETATVNLGPGETVKLRVFIDKSVIEVFVNGKQCVAMRVYPGRDDSTGVSIRAQGQEAELLSLDAWQMKSIYE
ncbi:glycoside hydrolase family 32 protein [Adhaeribacter radiodurans]|uniref:beta-fructofuranosidase n=1 Tax=Adhaeribacter radiodurans TaxID=2745197 RepID=A0A7L7LA91_9BACT|nr:glycoside hydrolase family 32 protein [Adhaeribacter radiodurans]QMU29465.1 glycoside hydrolase family 32 protein [Adhaeribacter radiodurans]